MEIKRKYINILLGILVVALLVAIIASVMSPVSFNNEARTREKQVIERMQTIRSAQARYRQVHDETFCTTLDSLVTAGFIPDSVKYIPYSDGKQFEMNTAFITTSKGKQVHVMECRAYYEDYLNGLSKEYIADIKNEAQANGTFPGLKFGDLTMPSDNRGNWE